MLIDTVPNELSLLILTGSVQSEILPLITRYGVPTVVTSRQLGEAIRECGAQIGIDAEDVYFPVGVGYDGIPIASRGFDTVTLSAGGFGWAALKIHFEERWAGAH